MGAIGNYIGTLPGWATLFTLIVVGVLLVRGGAGQAVSGLQDTNRELVRQVHDLQHENHELKERVRVLESKTDVAQAIVPVVEALQNHEVRAEQRHAGTLKVLDLIAARIGPENGTEDT